MTDRILVAYGTKHEATAEIAQALGTTLRDAGFDTDVKRARDVGSLDEYRAVVLGSAVYMGRWRRDAMRLLRRHRKELAQRDVWIFNSGPVGEQTEGDDERWTVPKRVRELVTEIGAHDNVVFGGRISEDAGGFIERSMVESTPPELRDRRDWQEIEAWAGQIAAKLS